MIDFAVPGDSRIEEKKKHEIENYQLQAAQVLYPNSLVID